VDHWLVCWDFDYVELVDLVEFCGLGQCGICYFVELVVYVEVVLQCDCCEGLVFVLDLYVFFGFDGLVYVFVVVLVGEDVFGVFVDD